MGPQLLDSSLHLGDINRHILFKFANDFLSVSNRQLRQGQLLFEPLDSGLEAPGFNPAGLELPASHGQLGPELLLGGFHDGVGFDLPLKYNALVFKGPAVFFWVGRGS
jgi:hypothetical protein